MPSTLRVCRPCRPSVLPALSLHRYFSRLVLPDLSLAVRPCCPLFRCAPLENVYQFYRAGEVVPSGACGLPQGRYRGQRVLFWPRRWHPCPKRPNRTCNVEAARLHYAYPDSMFRHGCHRQTHGTGRLSRPAHMPLAGCWFFRSSRM